MFDDIFSHLSSYLENLMPEDSSAIDTLQTDSDWKQVTDSLAEIVSQSQEEGNFWEPTNWYTPECSWNPNEFDGCGNPIQDAHFWQEQTFPTSCAVVAQISVFESITGVDLSETEVCRIAEEMGWYDPETGTKPDALGEILNALGVPTHQHYDATLEELVNALERGDKVIVALDANEIWTPLRDPITNAPIEQSDAGHAVWVTGIDQQTDGSVKIILNDSGTPDGQMKVVDAEDFLNAWSDFSNQLVVAHASQQQVIV